MDRQGQAQPALPSRLIHAPGVPSTLGEGQWALNASDLDVLNALDHELVVAVETRDEEGFREALDVLLAEVRRWATPLSDDSQEASELILSPAGLPVGPVTQVAGRSLGG
ncbi:hypothetical protein [Streptomyces sp. NPDC090132]|uniref:PspA-associated protein PspAA n=1 Tax=Streptomyces sp. NPDC090132 TaxID=3365955 RepID=UPI00382E2E38